MTPHVDLYIGPDHDLIHTALVLTGLCELARRGDITLAYRHPRSASDRWLIGEAIVLVLDVRHAGTTARIALDLRDGEGISYPIVERVDWYFKRAFYPPERDQQPAERRGRMVPFGLNFPCRSARSAARLLAGIGLPIALTGRSGILRLRQYLRTPPPSLFEQSPAAPLEPLVAFTTRLWAPHEVPAGEAEPLNAERVELVRGLRAAFGDRFVGGLVPTPLARERYPDDITPHSTNVADYIRHKKRCLIGVYSRGIEHSLAFKLGETFAAAQCLVSVPLRYELPVPLVEGTHLLEFRSVDECIAACRRLFADRELAGRMRQANADYYRSEIEPATRMWKLLRRIVA